MKYDINLKWSDYSAGLLCDAFQHARLSLTTAGSLCDGSLAARYALQHARLSPCHAFARCATLFQMHACTSSYTVCLVTVRHVRTSSISIYHRAVFPHSHTIIHKCVILNCTHPQQQGDSHKLNTVITELSF